MSHAGDLLAELLVGYGVTHVFGQPGGQTVALYDGLSRRRDRIKHLLVRDERSAAYAADAFGRLTGRPGVCDVTVGPGTTKLADVDERYMRAPAYRPAASADTIDSAADLLDRARRPVIVAGGGVHGSGATRQLMAVAERIDAAVVTSFSGKGAIAETDRHAAGVLNPLGTTESLAVTRRADVVFFVGCKVGQNTSHNWTLPLPEQATIHLDVDAAELGRTFGPTVALNGDARATLEALASRVRRVARPQWAAEVATLKEESVSKREKAEASGNTPIQPPRIMRELALRLGPDDVVVSDASFSAGWIATHLPARRAGRDFLFARGQGGLGYSVPAAIGAAVARPEGRVV